MATGRKSLHVVCKADAINAALFVFRTPRAVEVAIRLLHVVTCCVVAVVIRVKYHTAMFSAWAMRIITHSLYGKIRLRRWPATWSPMPRSGHWSVKSIEHQIHLCIWASITLWRGAVLVTQSLLTKSCQVVRDCCPPIASATIGQTNKQIRRCYIMYSYLSTN